MSSFTLLFLLHALSVTWMTGVIWLVQLVHYPAFSDIHPERFSEFHAFHSRSITWVVGPPMLIQLLSAVILVIQSPFETQLRVIPPAYLILTLLVFAVTAFASVPAHQVLAQGFDATTHATLVRTNWLRTFIWSAHFGLCLYGLYRTPGGKL
jgi:hypothetical protein